jgi:hypothetical protein
MWEFLNSQWHTIGIDDLDVSTEANQLWIGIERGDLAHVSFGVGYVVRVHPRNKITASFLQELIASVN